MLARWHLMGQNFLYQGVAKSLNYNVQWSIGDCLADNRAKNDNFVGKFDFRGENFSVFSRFGQLPLVQSNYNYPH